MALLAAFISLTNFEAPSGGDELSGGYGSYSADCRSFVCFYRWYEKGLHGIPWLAVFLMSLGTLTKGPVGSLIPCLVMGVFLLLRSIPFYGPSCGW